MTLGEKIRHSRKQAGLSQQQLAQTLCVSRSAIAKWETDNGMPDIENLKMLAKLFNVSVDSLLDDDTAEYGTVREAYNLSAYGRGCKKVRKDRLMRARFPGAKITTLFGRPELPNEATVIDNARGFLTDAPFGVPEYINSVKNLNKEFYLVDTLNEQFFVTVTDDFLEIRRLEARVEADRFMLGNWSFIRCAYAVGEENET